MGILMLLLGSALGATIAALVLRVRAQASDRQERQAPAILMAVADSTADAIFAKDIEGRYLLFSKSACRVAGKPSTEVIGRDDRAIFPVSQAEDLMATDREIRASGETRIREEVLDTANGERVFLAIKGPLRTPDGAIFGTYGISRDITDRKRSEMMLHANKEQLHVLVDHAPAALALFDKDMKYMEVSQRWRDDYSLGSSDIVGRSHYDVLPDVPERWKALHRRALAGEMLSADEDRFERSDGTIQWQRWEIRPWRRANGVVGGIVIFSEDITQRKVAELEIKQRNQELEHFNQATIERELRMIALKREVNELSLAAGRPAPYDVSFASAQAEESTQ